MAYEVEIHPAARKQMLSLPKEAQVKVARSIDHLGNAPRPPRVKKLADSGLWRIRAGQHRLVHAMDDKARLATIVSVARRKEEGKSGADHTIDMFSARLGGSPHRRAGNPSFPSRTPVSGTISVGQG